MFYSNKFYFTMTFLWFVSDMFNVTLVTAETYEEVEAPIHSERQATVLPMVGRGIMTSVCRQLLRKKCKSKNGNQNFHLIQRKEEAIDFHCVPWEIRSNSLGGPSHLWFHADFPSFPLSSRIMFAFSVQFIFEYLLQVLGLFLIFQK